jgi:hypothetical protein
MYTVIVSLRVKPDGQVSTFATPAFPADLPEAGR